MIIHNIRWTEKYICLNMKSNFRSKPHINQLPPQLQPPAAGDLQKIRILILLLDLLMRQRICQSFCKQLPTGNLLSVHSRYSQVYCIKGSTFWIAHFDIVWRNSVMISLSPFPFSFLLFHYSLHLLINLFIDSSLNNKFFNKLACFIVSLWLITLPARFLSRPFKLLLFFCSLLVSSHPAHPFSVFVFYSIIKRCISCWSLCILSLFDMKVSLARIEKSRIF